MGHRASILQNRRPALWRSLNLHCGRSSRGEALKAMPKASHRYAQEGPCLTVYSFRPSKPAAATAVAAVTSDQQEIPLRSVMQPSSNCIGAVSKHP